MGGMSIYGGGASPIQQAPGLDEPDAPADATQQGGDAEATTTLDPAQAAETWAAHAQDPTAAVIAGAMCQVTTPDDVDYKPDVMSMDQFYEVMPEFIRELDTAIELVGTLLEALTAAQASAGAEAPAQPTQAEPQATAPSAPQTQAEPQPQTQAQTQTQAGGAPQPSVELPVETPPASQTGDTTATAPSPTQAAPAPAPSGETTAPSPTQSAPPTSPTSPTGGPEGGAASTVPQNIQDLLRQLARLLANPPPNGPALNELTGSIDTAVAQWLSRTGEPPQSEVERHLGSSANGGGAVGNRLPPEAQTAAQTPPGYGSLDAARGADPVRRGESGEQVRALQEALNRAGAQPPLEVDGSFGPATEAAVRQFQQSHGCAVDGIVGPETLGAMDAALGLPRRSPPTSTPGTPTAPSEPGTPSTPGTPPTPTEPGGQTPGVPAPGTLPPPGAGGGWNGEGALAAAISQIGVREASGNNDGVPAERYSNGREVPWCANFVSWSFRQAGTALPGNQVAIGSCDEMLRQLRSAGAYHERGSYTPKPGDVIFFGRPGDSTHVGIVERVENGRVYTVEGNAGNRVTRRDYSMNDSYVLGYGST